ncbi:MAG: hypothetical protein ACQEWF_14625 [Bacillota bacterium]
MKFLTTEQVTDLELINSALKIGGLKEILSESEITGLGEGAFSLVV